MTAVIFGAHPWNDTPYGLHHIARALVKLGWNVVYVEPAFSPLHIISGRRRGRTFSKRLRSSGEPGISLISPFSLVPHANMPLLRSSMALKFSKLLWPALSKTLKETVFQSPDLVLCGSPSMIRAAINVQAKTSAYRLADDSRLFDVLTPAIRKEEQSCLSEFDAVLITSPKLKVTARNAGARKVVFVSNGVDVNYFQTKTAIPSDMPLQGPRILYAGAIETWFDWNVIINSASSRPQYQYVIVGKVAIKPEVDLPKNVFLLGQKPYSTMPGYMRAATVGIIPFASSESMDAVNAINPIKLYEYLAAGLPVVTSIPVPHVEDAAVIVYSSASTFSEKLDEAIELRHSGYHIAPPKECEWTSIVARMLQSLNL
ncbi:glycosyltransferase [Phyllobacterium sp. CCNWLW109]|uniref:glycosyltransferase n=1 Tax=Phyllobacterium sp. CCNWLW109 TaxID=3127479 RepID=UPI003077592D